MKTSEFEVDLRGFCGKKRTKEPKIEKFPLFVLCITLFIGVLLEERRREDGIDQGKDQGIVVDYCGIIVGENEEKKYEKEFEMKDIFLNNLMK